MKNFFKHITNKVGTYIITTLFLSLIVTGVLLVSKYSNELRGKIENQIQIPGNLLSKGLIDYEIVSDPKAMKQLTNLQLDECLIIGINNKVYYSMDLLQVGLKIKDLEEIKDQINLLSGLTTSINQYVSDQNNKYIINISPIYVNETELTGYLYLKANINEVRNNIYRLIVYYSVISILCIVVAGFIIFLLLNQNITFRIKALSIVIENLKNGDLSKKAKESIYKDEINNLENGVNILIENLSKKVEFANEIEKGNFGFDYKIESSNDSLAKALVDMRDSLMKASDEENTRKIDDEKRNWATHGIAKFGDILRQNIENIGDLSYSIVSNLVKYVKANQASLFLVNKENEKNVYLELIATYAYDRKKFKSKEIKFGEGLIGAVAIEKHTMYLNDIPDSYMEITSGLGKANPKSLLIVPLLREEELYGVIEIASFNKFDKFQIEFIEEIGRNIASTIYNAKINTTTSKLLKQSQEQAEQMRTQEEEMRQNVEELNATQEEMARKQEEQVQRIQELEDELAKYRSKEE